MDQYTRDFVSLLLDQFELPGPIWDIGSYCVPGQEELGNLRDLFKGRDFVGVDMREGPGVDLVENVQNLKAEDESVGTILCLNTMEHVCQVFDAAREMQRVIKPGGVLVIQAPFNFPIHDFPGDYWRFTPQALEVLTEGFETRLVGSQGYELKPRMSFVVAFKKDNAADVEGKLDHIKKVLEQAAEPKKAKLDRKIKYGLAKWLSKESLFLDYENRGDIKLKVLRK